MQPDGKTLRMMRGFPKYPADTSEIVFMPQTPYPGGQICRGGDLVVGVENLTDRQLHYRIVYKESWETEDEAKVLTQWHAVSPHDIHMLPATERVNQWQRQRDRDSICDRLWVRIRPQVTDSLLGIVRVCVGFVDEDTRRFLQHCQPPLKQQDQV